jgi:hypothetical protein
MPIQVSFSIKLAESAATGWAVVKLQPKIVHEISSYLKACRIVNMSLLWSYVYSGLMMLLIYRCSAANG